MYVPALLVAVVLAAEPHAAPSALPSSPPSEWLADTLREEAFAAIDRRQKAFEAIKTPEDARAWQAARKQFFIEQIGGIPEPTRPASQVVGTIDGGDYKVEKVIYESRPNHHVTAVLYLPKSKPPHPAVVICCGHSYDGKAAEGYQRAGILMAKHGVAALCFDPIGQGERYQLLNVSGRPGKHTPEKPNARLVEVQKLTPDAPPQYNPVEEHTLIGIGPVLLGANTAHYRVWDAMRSVDYLQSRGDIDPQRIGATGNSGGGTESSYLMALDDRIACAAPGCFLTSYRRLLETVGPQDAEQNIFGQLAFGMDEADYLTVTAPRPVCILAATRDATFDISGTWDVFREAKRFYGRLGHPERVDLVETDDVHGFTIHLREGAVRWMRRWLLGVDDAVVENDFPIYTPAELQCSPKGQVLLMPDERSVFDLGREWAAKLVGERRARQENLSPDELRKQIAERIGLDLANTPAVSKWSSDADSRRPALRSQQTELRTWLLRPRRVPLQIRIERTARKSRELVIYAIEAGIAGASREPEPLRTYLQEGKAVAVVELSGFGATRAAPHRGDWPGELFGPNIHEFYLAYLNGKSIVGLRAEDLLAATDFLAKDLDAEKVHVVAAGAAAIPALHAAAIQPERFASVELHSMLATWNDVVAAPVPENQLINTVHGALKLYDLPDLIGLAGGPDRVRIEEPVDAQGRRK